MFVSDQIGRERINPENLSLIEHNNTRFIVGRNARVKRLVKVTPMGGSVSTSCNAKVNKPSTAVPGKVPCFCVQRITLYQVFRSNY